MDNRGKSATHLLLEFANYGTPYCDRELNEAIDDLYGHGFGTYPSMPQRVSDHDFYDMVRVIQPYNFPVLAMEGLRTGHQVLNLLYDLGLHSLIYRSDKKVEVAQELGISPIDYTEICSAAHPHTSDEEVIRALRLYATLGTDRNDRGVPEIIFKILQGNIRYADAEHIGFSRFMIYNDYRTPLFEALHKMRYAGTYTRDDVMSVFSARPDATARDMVKEQLATKINKSRGARLELLPIAGGAAALTVRYPVVIRDLNRDLGHKIAGAETVTYIDSLLAVLDGERSKLPPLKDINLYREHGVDPELVVREREAGSDSTRIMALHEGTHSAMTGGWL
jgi:hypothetical protein